MKKIFQYGVIGLVLLMSAGAAFGQDPAGDSGRTSSNSAGVMTGGSNSMNRELAGDSYRIGPGDVLEIQVFNRPQLSGERRVDNDGNIEMPLIDHKIKAACLSETDLSKTIVSAYLKYQRNPYVSVFIKEYSSQPVAVIGAVEKPGQIILRRRMRLFDAITVAGGATKLAGRTVEIAHTGGASICSQGPDDANDVKGGFVAYSLRDTLRGDERANPWLQPGDYVRIPEAEQAFVIGNVYKPQPVSLREPLMVSRAVAMAGGVLRDSKLKKVTILRTIEGQKEPKLIVVDLGAINQRKADDVALMANDVVYVPEDGAAATRTKIINALTGGLASLPYLLP